jgi:hypothetical protein
MLKLHYGRNQMCYRCEKTKEVSFAKSRSREPEVQRYARELMFNIEGM